MCLSRANLRSLITFDENLEWASPVETHKCCVCVKDTRHSQTACFSVGSLTNIWLHAWGLDPYLRLCESVNVHGSELRLISGDGCFMKSDKSDFGEHKIN